MLCIFFTWHPHTRSASYSTSFFFYSFSSACGCWLYAQLYVHPVLNPLFCVVLSFELFYLLYCLRCGFVFTIITAVLMSIRCCLCPISAFITTSLSHSSFFSISFMPFLRIIFAVVSLHFACSKYCLFVSSVYPNKTTWNYTEKLTQHTNNNNDNTNNKYKPAEAKKDSYASAPGKRTPSVHKQRRVHFIYCPYITPNSFFCCLASSQLRRD